MIMANNLIQKQTEALNSTEPKTMQQYIKSMEGEIVKALPSVITPERFTRMVLTALSVNPKLAQCTPKSFLGAMMSAAQLGLEPNTPLGQAYIIPYNNKGVMEAQFQIGYKGLIDLAYRSGEVATIQAQVVYEKDEFTIVYGLDSQLIHKPYMDGDRGKPVAVYAMYKTKSGGYAFEGASIHAIRKHAEKYSKAYNSSVSPWQTSFDEMSKKTVLKKLLKYAPLKSDFVKAVTLDGTIKTEISDDMYSVPSVEIDISDAQIIDIESGEVISE